MSRRRGAVAGAALLLAGAVLGVACVASEAGEELPPTPTLEPVFRFEASATPAPAVEPLADDEVDDALVEVVCWYDDPDLARECLPPGEETLLVLQRIALSGDERFTVPLIDMLWLEVGWQRWVREALERITGQRFLTTAEWYAWAAEVDPPLPDGYPEWKRRLLAIIDPAFADVLHDEGGLGAERLVWAHNAPADLPALIGPETLHRVEENYLSPGDRVFGIVFDGIARAYPERIVAWHGVVRDAVGGRDIVLWHCTPCGGAVAFEAQASNGEGYRFGVSGLAYDSRRLFADEDTGSLWDGVTGRAVHGPLSDEPVTLARIVLASTTWGEWSARYPNTRVLSLDTGHVRDYAEGAALRIDNDPDRPMFPVAHLDDRHPPKQRVVGLALGGERQAYDLDAVESARLVQDVVGGQQIVLVSSGPGRGVTVYSAADVTFVDLEGSGANREVVDDEDGRWAVTDERLRHTETGATRSAIPSRTLYWFAWAGAYPTTGLWAP